MSHPASNPLSILFVDDEAKSRKYFAMGLADNFSVVTADGADEAEAILARGTEQFAVLITDQMMPGRTGSSLLSNVRKSNPDIVRILTTAFSDIQGAIEAVNKGEVFRYITKPWDFDNLRQEIRIAVQIYELQRDRDSLLAEKLSVKMRLRAAERARLLIGLSGAFPSVPRLHEAVGAYIVDMAALNATPTASSGPPLDMWADAEAEARFAKAIAAEFVELTKVAVGNGPGDGDAAADPSHGGRVIWSNGIDGEGATPPAAEMAPKVLRLSRLLTNAVPTVMADVRPILGEINGEMVRLVAEGQQRSDAHDPLLFGELDPASLSSRSAMLKVYAMAHAMNGSMETTVDSDRVLLKLAVPLDPTRATLTGVRDDGTLNRRIFQSLENWL